MRWASSLEGETLRVYQTAKGGGQSGAIVAGAENVLTQAGTYTLSGQVADGTRLVVNGEQIQIVLKTATLPAGVTITGNVNYNRRRRCLPARGRNGNHFRGRRAEPDRGGAHRAPESR